MRNVHGQRLLAAAEGAEIRHIPVQANQPKQALDEPASPWLLKPVVQKGSICRSAIPNRTFMVRQVWTAAPLSLGCRPRLSVGCAVHDMFGSNQIVSEPRRLSALL